jgi:hypothetical protein
MPGEETRLQLSKRVCENIVEKGKNIFSWQWDPYFQAALSVIQSTDQKDALQLFEEYCGKPMDERFLSEGTPDIRDILNQFGGLRSGQIAFITDRQQPSFILVTWWPWNNGSSISIRLRLLNEDGPIEENDEAYQMFKSWFGV